jgi:hypothetical protein
VDFVTLKGMLAGFAGVEDDNRFPPEAQAWCLNFAARRLTRRYEMSYNATSDFADTAASSETLALPTRCSKMYRAYFYDSSGAEVKLKYYPTEEEFRKLYPVGTSPGTPAGFCMWGRNMLLGPPADSVIRIYRLYWEIVADLVNDADTNALIENAYEAVLFTALADFAPLYLIEDARIPVWKAQAADLVSDLTSAESRAEVSAGGLVMEFPG